MEEPSARLSSDTTFHDMGHSFLGDISTASSSRAPRRFFVFLPEHPTGVSDAPPVPPPSHLQVDSENWKLGPNCDNGPPEPLDGDVCGMLRSQFARGEDEARRCLSVACSSIRGMASPQMEENDGGLHDSRKRKGQGSGNLEDGRNYKLSDSSPEEVEIWKLIDDLLLSDDVDKWKTETKPSEKAGKFCPGKGDPGTRASRRGRLGSKVKEEEVVDISGLLVKCARAVSVLDYEEAQSLMGVIRKNSSPLGDGWQRCVHHIADALEGRLLDLGAKSHYTLTSNKLPVIDILKFHKLVSATPVNIIPIQFAHESILKIADKATTLHIIDFGIRHGIQWPGLIKSLSSRPGGPPKLRITGIEFPETGFRPARSTSDTGSRLAECCFRFGVTFQFNAVISATWETIRLEDLRIQSDETVAVNCLIRLSDSLDETHLQSHESPAPRDAVLRLIRAARPHIFVHTVLNGCHNSPFFVFRFKEIMHHFASVFDMFHSTRTYADSAERLAFEKEVMGLRLMNAIACEGPKRIERSERYSQWARRMTTAGLIPIPLDKQLVRKLREVVNAYSLPNFHIEEDGFWLLNGWKGRMFVAMSCWNAPND